MRLKSSLLLVCLFVSAAFDGMAIARDQQLLIFNIEIFQGTPVWQYAKELPSGSVEETEKVICEIPTSLINTREPRFGATLLGWAVWSKRLEVVKQLLLNGADPNVIHSGGLTPFIQACGRLESTDILRLMIQCGANVNLVTPTNLGVGLYRSFDTPLVAAVISGSMTKVKLLVDSGADVDAIGADSTPAIMACRDIDILYYLLITKRADCNRSVRSRITNDYGDIGNHLRMLTYPIGSPEHERKMEVVEYIRRTCGIDYWAKPVPYSIRNRFKSEYLQRY
jgi:hypothetical protein